MNSYARSLVPILIGPCTYHFYHPVKHTTVNPSFVTWWQTNNSTHHKRYYRLLESWPEPSPPNVSATRLLLVHWPTSLFSALADYIDWPKSSRPAFLECSMLWLFQLALPEATFSYRWRLSRLFTQCSGGMMLATPTTLIFHHTDGMLAQNCWNSLQQLIGRILPCAYKSAYSYSLTYTSFSCHEK